MDLNSPKKKQYQYKDPISIPNISAELKRLNCPITSIPHYTLWVKKWVRSDNFKGEASFFFRKWLINYTIFRKILLDAESTGLDPSDYDIVSCAEAAIQGYFSEYNTMDWDDEKEAFLKWGPLTESIFKNYGVDNVDDLLMKVETEVILYITDGKEPIEGTKICKRVAKKRIDVVRRNVSSRIDYLYSLGTYDRYNACKALTHKQRQGLTSRGFHIPTKGEFIASMNKCQFNAWCMQENIDENQRKRLERRYRRS